MATAVRHVPRASAEARSRNQRIRNMVRADTVGTLPFFCECGMESCRRSVWLTLEEARDLIQTGGLIIGTHSFQGLDALRDPGTAVR